MYPRSYTTNWLTKTKPILVVFLVVANIFSSVTIPAFFDAVPRAEAAFNAQINYQGKLTNASNVAVADGVYHMKFWLLTSPTAATTTAIWTEDRSTVAGNRVTVSNGLFSVMLGSSTPLTTVDFNQTLYLGVEVGGSGGSPSWDGEMSPRKVLGAVPAAFEADKLDGLSSQQFFRTDATNATSSATTSLSVVQNGAGKIAEFFGPGASSAFSILSTGNVGVGTTSPYSKLSVAGDVVARSYTATSTTATSTFAGKLGVAVTKPLSATSTFQVGDIVAGGPNTWSTFTGYDDFGMIWDAHNGWSRTIFSSGYATGLQIYNVGTNNTTNSLTIGKHVGPFATGNARLTLTAQNQVFMYIGANSVGNSTARLGVLNPSNNYTGDFYVDTASAAATYKRFVFANTGAFKADFFTATSTTATSTFAAGIQTTLLNVTSSTATSTFANGINLTAGCFSIGGTCVGGSGGSGTVGSGTTGQFAYYAGSGTTLTATSSLFLATSGNVGVGSTTPFNRLSVIGGDDQATAYFYNNNASGKTRLTIRGGSGNSNSGSGDPVLSIQNSAGTQTAFIRADGLIGSTFLGTSDDSSVMLVDSSTASVNYPQGVNLGVSSVVSWAASQWYNAKDIGLSRGAAGKLYVGNGTQGTSNGTLIAGSIGVGTTTPSTTFGVAGSAYISTALGVGTVNTTAGTLNVKATGSGGSPVAQLVVPNKSSASRMLSFYEATSGADWNIWMGTETIPYFYVGGGGATSQYFWRANWNDTAAPANTFKSASDGANQVVVGIQGASAQSADYVQVTTSGSTAGNIFKINSSGNVGIGTTSPYAKLSVNGRGVFNQDVRADYFTATSTTATSTFAGFIDVNGTGTNATSTFASNLWVKGALRIGTSSLYLDTNGISSTDGTLKLRAGTTATSTFPLLSVGTTTATTTAKLMVDGAFNLNSSNGALVIGDTLGNARGARSIDIQSRRASATQVSSGLDSIALGSLNTASGQYSNAIGYGNAATAASVALGWGNGAYGFASTAIGYGNSSNADAVTAIGYNNSGQAYGNTLYGENNTIPSGERNIAIGHANTVDTVNGFSAAFGFSNSIVSAVSGTDHSFAVGYGNAIVSNSVGGNSAFGNNIIVDYNNSTEDTIVFGKDFTASNITDGVVLANATNQLILVDGSGWYASGITESAGTGSLCFDSGTAKILLNDFSDDCTSSTRVTKHNIQDLNVNGLEMIQELNPVSFIYNNGNGRTKYGFIAEDSVAVDERFGSFNSMGSLTGIDDTAIISITVKSIQEVASRISLNAAPTSTPSIVINSIGNVGFGIEDADYKIEAAGDVSGYGFAIKSDRSAVSNVEEVDQETIESYAEKIRDIELSTYSYEGDTSTSTRLGILSNDAPSEILTAQGDIDMYKLAVFTLGAVQAQQLRLDDIEARLEAVEAAVLVDGGSLLGNPFQIFEDAGITITETLAQFKNVLVAGLTVGSEEKPTGITLYDTETGSPYCVKVKNGKLKSFLGACEEASDVEVPDDKEPTLPVDDNTPTDASTPTTPDDTNETPHEPTVPADGTPAEPTTPDTDSNLDVATPDASTEVSSADTDSSGSSDSGSDSDAGDSSSGGETSSAGSDSGPQS